MFDEWIPEIAVPMRMRPVTQTALYGPHGPEDKWAVCSVDDSMRP